MCITLLKTKVSVRNYPLVLALLQQLALPQFCAYYAQIYATQSIMLVMLTYNLIGISIKLLVNITRNIFSGVTEMKNIMNYCNDLITIML